jgi:NADH-ubiquinone oxidoreductase chain 6
MKNLLINILAFASLLSSVLVITSKNPIISIVYLIATFVCAAGYLILSGIVFIGISYIIIYLGAITVIFLFIIMMINIKLTDILESGSQYTKNFPLAFAIGFLFIYELFNILPFTLNKLSGITFLLDVFNNLNRLLLNTNTDTTLDNIFITYNPNIFDISFTNFLQIQAVGQSIYTYEAILLIILSVILLLAMIAPIFISSSHNNKKI